MENMESPARERAEEVAEALLSPDLISPQSPEEELRLAELRNLCEGFSLR